MKNIRRWYEILLMATVPLLLLVALNSCSPPKTTDSGGGSDNPAPPPPSPTMAEFVADAWTAYNLDDISQARTALNSLEYYHFPDYQTYAPYWNVNGWISVAEQNTTGALTRFDQAIAFESTLVAPYLADPYVGKAGLHLLNNEFSSAITSGEAALTVDSSYNPGHDSLTVNHIYVLLAEAYYYEGDLTNSLLQVQAIDPTYTDPDPINLLNKIEQLSQALPP